MKCRLVEKREKELEVSALQKKKKKKKLHPKGTKVCLDKAFLPCYQTLSDNRCTNTLQSVLRISYPE